MQESPPLSPAHGLVLARLRAAIAAGHGAGAILDTASELPDAECWATGAALPNLLADAPETSRSDVLAWVVADERLREFAIWPLVEAWPAWLGPRDRELLAAACRGAYLVEKRPLLDERVARLGAWSDWIWYLVHGAIPAVPEALVTAFRAGGTIEAHVLQELASAVTTWSRTELEPVCRGIAHAPPVEKAKWRLALVKCLKNDSPLWAVVGPALESQLPVDAPECAPDR